MDESFISLDQPQVRTVDDETAPRRRFWTMRLRRRSSQDGAADGEQQASSHTADSTRSWKVKTGSRRDRKKSRLSIWKSWFLALVKPKSKATMSLGMQEPDLVDLNTIPSFVMTQPPLSIATDSILDTWRKAKEANLVMIINLPENVAGKDIKLNVELKALPKTNNKDLLDLNMGLRFVEQSSSGPVYFGTVKVPPFTTILQVSQMPLYLVNPKSSKSEPKIETIIKPAENILPENYDQTMIVEDIAIRIDFETKVQFDLQQLVYEFRLDVVPIVCRDQNLVAPDHASLISLDLDPLLSSTVMNTTDLIDQITKEPVAQGYNEATKMLVKEILNQVVSKISLTSTDFIEDFHKELELQKSLLLETTSSILPNSDSLLSKISETDQEDTASASKTLFKPTPAEESDHPAANVDWPQDSKSCLAYHVTVPANSPDPSMLPYLQKISSTTKQEVRADIDRTLELLEMAKNRLLKYLSHGHATAHVPEPCRSNQPSREDLLEVCSPEGASTEEEAKPPDIAPPEDPIVAPAEAPKPEEVECESEDEETTEDTKSLTNPVHEMHLLLLEEFQKETGIDITGKEKFDLEDLAKANVFVDESRIDDMTDDYISDEDIYLMGEYWNMSLNDEIFEERFAEDEELSDFAKERLEDDISIMLREIEEQSEEIKDVCKRKIKENIIIKDVQYVLERVVQRVERQISQTTRQQALVPLVPQVSPVYFCLIDDYVDVFLTAERTSAWIAHRLRTMSDTERKSTVSVRRISANGQRELSARGLEISRPDGLLQNLEKGCAYLSELYKEIFARNLSYISNNLYNNMSKNQDHLPVARKSNKLTPYEKRSSAVSETPSSEEQVEKVVNPEDETPKAPCAQKFSELDPYAELSTWPTWKRSWIKLFTKQHASSEVDGFRQLNDLVTIRRTVNPNNPLNRTYSGTSMLGSSRNYRHCKKLRIKPFDLRRDALLSFMDRSIEDIEDADKSKKVSFATEDEDDDDNPNKGLTKKKSFKTSYAPAFSNDPAVPGPSSTQDDSLLLLHETDTLPPGGEPDLESIDESILSEKFPQPVADIPRGFATSSMEQAYMNNLKVLQEKMHSISLDTLYSTSSSSSIDSYHPMDKTESSQFSIAHSYTSSMLGHQSSNTMSKENYLPFTESSSEASSQSVRFPVVSTDYHADTESAQVDLPNLKHTYVSKPEVNPPEVIARIEGNVYQNDYCNPPMKSLSDVAVANPERTQTSTESPSTASSPSLKSTEMDLHEKN